MTAEIIARRIATALILLLGLSVILWCMGAFWYDFPAPVPGRKAASILFLLVTGSLWLFGKRGKRLIAVALVILVMAWWFGLAPRNDRKWLADVARTAHAEINGDQVVFHNVRNFDYRTETDYVPRWETRTVDLSKLTGIDLALNYWGSPYMAHPVVSFQFSDSPPLCFSIETRKEEGESYSAIGGIYRQYELIYIVADERDVIRVRTNYRKGEDVYLYRLNISPEKARERFMDYVTALNELHDKAGWYNALTTNCTTSIRTQNHSGKRQPWDWRMLVNGKADEMLQEQGAFRDGGLPFHELKLRSRINDAARAANDDPDFSARIRAGLPPFSKP
ncbi:DUF4105 domain-containing protein [Luteolibacter yonseiensis]|uniref:DUF4105 domain-containing protein n=1 Tax=Luteolibacter yonseiensis TaxID=1144680 RepID=A0A934VCT3_9BACT|nr:DUF4105 domain-containing protein [Luteolibacter yonseiensis]MBK1816819.1 DUF4105 domain-containing protein [Luteolibacter yonseiensis]